MLRDYQRSLIEGVRRSLMSVRRTLAVLPTGGGKSVILTAISKSLEEKGKRALILAHRQEIVKQLCGHAAKQGVKHGRIMPGAPFQPGLANIQIGMIATAKNRAKKGGFDLFDIDLIIIDEAHHTVAATYLDLLAEFPNARVLGFTATPQRLDGKGLSEVFQDMVRGPNTRELMDLGFLCDYRYFMPKMQLDTDGIKSRTGDYARDEVEERATRPAIIGDAVEQYERHFNGKSCVVFCVTIAHAERVLAAYQARGWRADIIHGKMTNDEREAVVRAFDQQRISVLVSVDVISEGFDIPFTQGVQMLRPTKSIVLYLQQVGRALRPKPDGSKAIILDHVGNVERFGLPDEERDWSLQGRTKRKSTDLPIHCAMCGEYFNFGAVAKAAKECELGESCGLAKDEDETADRMPDEIDGDLEEVNRHPLQKAGFYEFKKMIMDASTTEEALRLAKLRRKKDGKPYRDAWVYRVRDEVPPWQRNTRRQSFSV